MASEEEELRQCARYGEYEEMEALLSQGTDPRAADPVNGMTALHYACGNGHEIIVKRLIDAGAVATPNSSGNTPLHWAVQNGHSECVETLTSMLPKTKQLDVLHCNKFGKSAISEAFTKQDAKLIKTILEHASTDEGMRSMDDEVNGAESNRAGHSQETCEGGTESTLSVTHEFCHSGEVLLVRELVPAGPEGEGRSSLMKGQPPLSSHDSNSGVMDTKVLEASVEHDGTGSAIWAASIVLWRWLCSDSIAQRIKCRTVLELGAGCGLPSIAAASDPNAAPAIMVISDGNEEALMNGQHNVELNKEKIVLSGSEVSVQKLNWDGELDCLSPTAFDFVVGADLVYKEDMTERLAHVVARCVSEGGSFLYVHPQTMRSGQETFFSMLKKEGLSLCVDELAPEEFSSNPLASGNNSLAMVLFPDLATTTFCMKEFRRC
eukprot:521252_1